jgi:phytoene desaturase
MTSNNRHVIVVGAGIGGLAASIRLTAAGMRVTLLEKNATTGGKMSQIEADGFRWDTGPSVITMRHVLEDLFASAGRSMTDYLMLMPVEPLTRYFWPDGTRLDATADVDVMAARAEALQAGDGAGYRRYLKYASTIHRVTGPVFIYDRPPRPRSFLKVSARDWLKADPFRTMQAAIRARVKSPYMRQLLGRFATYVGGSPYLAPATLNVIADVELSGGVWYPQGGIYAIAEALERLARELGVEIVTQAPVSRFLEEAGRVTGVCLQDGRVLNADAVLSNVDVTTTVENLLAPSPPHETMLKRLRAQSPSCSGFVLLLGIEGQHEALAHHNILFSQDYAHEFDQIFAQGVPADDPTVYVAITSKAEAQHAPEGCENWFVLVNAPALSSKTDWSSFAPVYRDRVLERVAAFGLDIRRSIRSEHMLTPVDLEGMTGAYRGALYGASANSKWTAFRRPHNRSKTFPGLYFAGGTTHPGGGVPMVMLSGKVAADLIVEDLR